MYANLVFYFLIKDKSSINKLSGLSYNNSNSTTIAFLLIRQKKTLSFKKKKSKWIRKKDNLHLLQLKRYKIKVYTFNIKIKGNLFKLRTLIKHHLTTK